MANQNNGRTERDNGRTGASYHPNANDEHGYQDPRDNGMDRNARGRGDDRQDNNREQFGNDHRDFNDYRRGSGYGFDDMNAQDQGRDMSNYRRDDSQFRGQSGSQAGFRGDTRTWGNQGGNPGRWGEFDRGGRWSPTTHDGEYNSQSPSYGKTDRYSQHGGYGEGQYDMQNQWRRDQRQWRDDDNTDPSNRQMNRGGYGFEGQSGYTGGQYTSGRGDSAGYGYRNTSGPHAGKGPQGYQKSDERINEIVHDALTEHGHVDASNITVEVKNGEVTLTGHIEDRNAKRMAEDIVASQTGVKDVINHLRIGASDNAKMSGGSSVAKKNSPAT